MRKKFLAIILSLTLIIGASLPLTGCGGNRRIYIYVPDGAPLIAAAHMFYEGEDVVYSGGTRRVRYVQTTGQLIGSALVRNRPPDFALAPINLAATNYNTMGNFVFGGVALRGVFHIVENITLGNNRAQNLSDLVGETIFAYQENMSPGIVLETVLEKAGLDINRKTAGTTPNPNAVNIVYLADNGQARDALMGQMGPAIGNARFALIADPVVSALVMQDRFEVAFNMQQEWYNLFGFSFPQVAIMVRSTIAQREPALANAVIDMISRSIAKAAANPAETARIIETLESVYLPPTPVITNFLGSDRGSEVFSFSNVSESRTAVKEFLNVLHQRGAPIGGRVPDDGFFFGG